MKGQVIENILLYDDGRKRRHISVQDIEKKKKKKDRERNTVYFGYPAYY